MIKFRAFFLTCCFLLATYSLSAHTIGPSGRSLIKDEVEWSPIQYDDSDCGALFNIPGKPICGTTDSFVYAESKLELTNYSFAVSHLSRYICPTTEKAFLRQVNSEFRGRKVKINAIPSSQKNVKYIAEVESSKENFILRIYASSNQLYWFKVRGKNRSLAPLFFSSIQITK